MKGHLCHIEIPADDLGSRQKFYSGLFEWDFDKVPGDVEYYGINHGDDKPMGGMMSVCFRNRPPFFTFAWNRWETPSARQGMKDQG